MASFLQPVAFNLGVLAVVLGMLLFSLGLLKEGTETLDLSPTSSSSMKTAEEVKASIGPTKVANKVKAPEVPLKVAEGVVRKVPFLDVQVDIDLLQDQIDKLGKLSDHEPPSVTRILFTTTDLAGRRYVRSLMIGAGLDVHEDTIGNIYGRWVGEEPALPRVLTGSHTDAIPHAGKYDGVLGVLGAIEAISALKRAGFKPKRSIEVVMFTSEEPTRFGYGCLGSRMMANQEGFADKLRTVKDKNNISFVEAAAEAHHPEAIDNLDSVIIQPGTLSAFVELHIEQGPLLEAEGVPIGVVTAIAAPAALIVEMKGGGGHAGGVLMEQRNDAGLAAAELALAVESHVLATGSRDTVGTTGKVELYPGAINSIPRVAHLEIDVRDIDGERRDRVVADIKQSAKEVAERRRVELIKWEVVNADPPAHSSEMIVQTVEKAASELGLPYRRMVSRAYHDSLFMARVAPMGMIFIPCYKGYSHRPDEFASKQDMAQGVQVLALTLASLSAK